MMEKPAGPNREPQPYDAEGKYMAKTELDDEALESIIRSNPKLSSHYDSLPDVGKAEFLSKFRNIYNQKKTEIRMSKRYDSFKSDEDYLEWARGEEQSLKDKYGQKEAQSLLDAFHSEYKGKGANAFNKLHCMRVGYETALEEYSNALGCTKDMAILRHDFPTKESFEDWSERITKLANSSEAPNNMQLSRFVDENALYDLTKGFSLWDDLDIKKNEYGIPSFSKDDISVDEMVSRMQNLIGMKIDGDKAITSFSAKSTHMGNKMGAAAKRIRYNLDVDKGQKLFPCAYKTETEVLLPPKMSYFIKDVKKETERTMYGDEVERMVIYLGIR